MSFKPAVSCAAVLAGPIVSPGFSFQALVSPPENQSISALFSALNQRLIFRLTQTHPSPETAATKKHCAAGRPGTHEMRGSALKAVTAGARSPSASITCSGGISDCAPTITVRNVSGPPSPNIKEMEPSLVIFLF